MRSIVYVTEMLWDPFKGIGRRWTHYDDGSVDVEDFTMTAPVLPPIYFPV